MGKVLKTLAVIASAITLAACSPQMPPHKTQALLKEKVQIGMSWLAVEQTYGFPQKMERVGDTTFFFYSQSWYIPSYFTNNQNPVALVNDKVVGVGTAYYESTVANPSRSQISN